MYVRGVNENLHLDAENVDSANGDSEYCNLAAKLYTDFHAKEDSGEYIKGCIDGIRQEFGLPDNLAPSKARAATQSLVTQLNANSSSPWAISKGGPKSVLAGFKAELDSDKCVLQIYANKKLAIDALVFGAVAPLGLSNYLHGVDPKTKLGILFFYSDSKQPCAIGAAKTLTFDAK